jgi:hypothetical protein
MRVINREDLSVGDMKDQMLERRPLPIGKTEFMEWSQRIIEGAHVSATEDSLRFSLAAMLMHLAPTEAFKEDAYFILSLRKAAVNETAHFIMTELKEQQKQKELAEATAPTLRVVDGVLENKEV